MANIIIQQDKLQYLQIVFILILDELNIYTSMLLDMLEILLYCSTTDDNK